MLFRFKRLPAITVPYQRARAFLAFRAEIPAVMPDTVAIHTVPEGSADQ